MIESLRAVAATTMTAVSALALPVSGPASPASAGVLDVTCTAPSSQTDTYTPPLSMTPQNVTVGSATSTGHACR